MSLANVPHRPVPTSWETADLPGCALALRNERICKAWRSGSSQQHRQGVRRNRRCHLKRIACTFLPAVAVAACQTSSLGLGFAHSAARSGRLADISSTRLMFGSPKVLARHLRWGVERPARSADSEDVSEADWDHLCLDAAGTDFVETDAGHRALLALCNDPIRFQTACDSELQAARTHQEHEYGAQDSIVLHGIDVSDTLSSGAESAAAAASLRRRIAEVQRQERSRGISEVLQLQTLHACQQRGIALAPPLSPSDSSPRFIQADPKTYVVGLYSQDATELLQNHIAGIIGDWDHLARDYALRVSLFQAGQLYATSALFGYALRRADGRYALERRAGGAGEGAEVPDSLAEYVASFSAEVSAQVASVASWEVASALERQVSALFGDLAALRREVAAVLLEPTSPAAIRDKLDAEEMAERLKAAILNDEVAATRLSVRQLRQLALEACAFGSFLSDAEARANTMVDLMPSTGESLESLLGSSIEEGTKLPAFRIFGV